MSDAAKIGKRIHTFRAKLDMSVDDLASRASLPVSLVKDIEGGNVSPALGVMVKLARALGQRVGTFMDDQLAKDPVITRSVEREEGVATHKGKAQGHYRYHALGAGKADRHMEPFFIKISPSEEIEKSSHEGEEFVVVVAGAVELQYGNDTHVLHEGDTMYYNSLVPHCVRAIGGDAQIYAVIFTL
jgi:quercetin dioxygenase-like cupin family protein/DNA-binding XRE family transcriptional regulator